MNKPLLHLLRKGGYILYAKHGEATVGEDQAYLNFQYCSTQRNLSEAGRRQAITYGEALRRLYIPVEYPVLASPLCRTKETAELAFGKDNVQVDPFWAEIYKLSGNLSAAEQERILNALRSVLEIQPPRGNNKVIIAHSFPKAIGLGQIPDMGTVVVKSHGQGKGYEVVAQVSLAELTSLLE
ncbi:histidine phosphatase family protein [Domibacillus mangrovi]|uniref:Histidine phosphatase family protein n=1 Tax=Domibacillus mangrovi TaxID=1714354 RepID=A0A1Q5P3Y8_9BACI|nr:histidine phosphatase family protein [Domibacillus mangrovi]OKL36957.1 histidine phosphatase family protein [Domibacillus mangrovi]